MSKRYTVKTNYNAIKALIDNHKVYRGNNTSFCIDMGFENRTSWVSDLKRNRNLPSPEEAVRMCQRLNTTPEEILMHEGKGEKETAKCQEDIKRVRELLEQAEKKESAPDPKIEGAKWDNDEDFKEAVALLKKMDKETLRVFVKAARGAVGEQQR